MHCSCPMNSAPGAGIKNKFFKKIRVYVKTQTQSKRVLNPKFKGLNQTKKKTKELKNNTWREKTITFLNLRTILGYIW